MGFTLARVEPDEADLCVFLNMGDEGRRCRLPSLPDRNWNLVLDTGRDLGVELVKPQEQVPRNGDDIHLEPHSLVVMEGR